MSNAGKRRGSEAVKIARLAGGNTIRQAEKPSRAKVTLPAIEGAPTYESFNKIKADLRSKQQELFRAQVEIEKAHDKIADLEKYKSIVMSLNRGQQ